MEIPKSLYEEITQFCELNEITNVDEYIIQLIITGFNISKYGASPLISKLRKIESEHKNRVIPHVPIEERMRIDNGINNKNKQTDIYNEE